MQRSDLTPQTTAALSVSVLGLVFGMSIGVKFADIDLRFPEWLLHHRALLTHGCIIPLLLSWAAWRTQHQILRGFTIGFCVTNAVHLSFDLFPRAWWGHALIHISIWAFPPWLSWLWIAVSIVVCLYISRFFIRTLLDLMIAGVGIVIGFVVYIHEGILLPLSAFFLAGVVAFLLPFHTSIRNKNAR